MRGSGERSGTSMRYGKTRTISNHDFICASIRIVKSKILQISGDMMRGATGKEPRGIKCARCEICCNMCVSLPRIIGSGWWLSMRKLLSKQRATRDYMTLSIAPLAAAKKRTSRVAVSSIGCASSMCRCGR